MMDKDKLLSNFGKKGFECLFFDKREVAISYIVDKTKGKQIGFGGSMTLKELNLYEKLKADNTLCWHWIEDDKETRMAEIESEIFICKLSFRNRGNFEYRWNRK